MAGNNNEHQILDLFTVALNVFPPERDMYYSGIDRPRIVSKYVSFEVFVRQLPALLKEKSKLFLANYLFQGSIGTGNVSEVPWICIFDLDITTSAQKGYYIVFLVQANMEGIYLSLNQGFTEYKDLYGSKNAIKAIRKNATKYQNLIKDIQGFTIAGIKLEGKSDLAEGYEAGNICSKFYPIDQFPDDITVLEDLNKLVSIYSELKQQIIAEFLEDAIQPSEEDFQDEIQIGNLVNLPTGKIERDKKKTIKAYQTWTRRPDISFTALHNANFKCENDEKHMTFTSAKSGHQFVEAHHLIPMEFQDLINASIDVPENILSLCPNCHRAFHNSKSELKRSLIQSFYSRRKLLLESREIIITEDKLKEYYKVLSLNREF